MANDLKLRVLLNMIDGATRPLKNILSGNRELARSVKDSRDQLKELGQVQKDVASFRDMRAAMGTTKGELDAARARVNALSASMRQVGPPTKEMVEEFQKAKTEAGKLKYAYEKKQTQLQELRSRLAGAGIETRNLSQHERALRSNIDATNAAMTKQQAKLAELAARERKLAEARSKMRATQETAGRLAGTGAGMMAAGAATGAPVLKSVQDYMAFEDSMLGVAKQLDGARDANGQLTKTYYDMAVSIQQLGRELPVPTNAIAEMVAAGLRMGVAKNEVLDFVRRTAEMSTAFEIPEGELAENMGKIAGLYKIPIPAIGGLADTINYLDDNAISKGGDIIDFLQRVGGVAGAVAVKDKEMAALGSTLLTLGERTETAGTATNAIMQKFAAAESGTNKFKAAMSGLGLSTKDIQKGMQVDALGTIMKVMDTIAKQPKDMQVGYLTELVGLEHADTFAKLANNADEFRRQLELANSAAAGGSMKREFDARMGSMSAQWAVLKNQLGGFTTTLGATLAPAIKAVMQPVGKVLENVSAWINANPVLAGTLMKIAVVVAMLLVGLGGLALTVSALLGPFAMLRFTLTTLGLQGGIMARVFSLGAGALRLVGQAAMFIGRALLMNPIGASIAAIAAAAYLIYRYWEPIKAFFAGLWTEVRSAFAGGIGGIAALFLNWSPLGLFYKAFATVLSFLGVEMPAKFTEFGANLLAGLVNGITSRLGAVKDAIVNAGSSAVGWFKEKLGIHSPSRVFGELGGFITQGAAIGMESEQGRLAKAAAGLAMVATTAFAPGIAQAASLPITGTVPIDSRPPISAPASATAAGGASGGDNIQIIIQGAGMDPQTIAKAVAAELDKRDRAKQSRIGSRLTD